MHNLVSANIDRIQAYESNTLLIPKIPTSSFAMFQFHQGWSTHHEAVGYGAGI